MRIVTRPDFDGIVCATLLYDAEQISKPTKWVQPNDMQRGLVPITNDDVIANLPYAENCALWFDHHVTNHPNTTFRGAYKTAPSAARVVFEYYQDRFTRDYEALIQQTDDIDSANLSRHQIQHPEDYPYVLLSMTISGRDPNDEPYWNKLVRLLGRKAMDKIMAEPEVDARCQASVARNNRYRDLLLQHTRVQHQVAITDFRSLQPAPEGNRFLPYSLFPDAIVSVKIRYRDNDQQHVIVSVGHSILNKACNVNVGMMLSRFGGGGHAGAGACSFHRDQYDTYMPKIISILEMNKDE